MDRTALRQLFAWGRCQSCMMVTEGWDALAPAPNLCPDCGQSGFGVDWPPEPSRLLLKQAFHREPDDQEEFAVKALLVAAAVDVILEWVLCAAVDYLSTESQEVARLVDKVRQAGFSTEQRMKMLKEVTDIPLSRLAGLHEELEFPPRWRELRQRRDRFLHSQEMFAFDGLKEDDLFGVARAAVKVFAHVNNMVW
jgi:hypothetical protein